MNKIFFGRYFFPISILVVAVSFLSCKENAGNEPELSNSIYVTQVFDYVYAPGQHAQLAKPADIEHFIGEPSDEKGFLYLGGFGGYVIAGFDHDIQNKEGYDLEIFALPGATPEPAIVYVMSDDNGDGKPNEIWYELKGNQFENEKRNYWVRYYKPTSSNDNIQWKDSEGESGELVSGFGAPNTSSWWWPTCTEDSITLEGPRLPDAYDDNSSEGTQSWKVPEDRFVWGYAENNFGTDYDAVHHSNKLDISNAVDASGKAVHLEKIRFIKIQTAVFQRAGWVNEVSAEIRGAAELK
jgi:hypothetical protein